MKTQHAEGLVLGDNGNRGGTEAPSCRSPDQYREDRGVDESAVGEVDQQLRGALRQSLLDLCLELSNGCQVQLPAHLKYRDARVERPSLHLGSLGSNAAAVVASSDSQDTIRC